MHRLRTFALALLFGGAISNALYAQSKPDSPARARAHQLRFEKLSEMPEGAIDSFVTVKARSKQVTVTMAFNNPCGFRPNGRYSLTADTLFFLIRYKADTPESMVCPGGPWFQAFAASTDTLQSGRYTFRMVMEHGSRRLGPQVYRGKLDIE